MGVNVWPWRGRRSQRGRGRWRRCGRVSWPVASEGALGVSALIWRHAIVAIENAFVIV